MADPAFIDVRCRSCDRPLASLDLWGDAVPPFDVVAECCYCGDRSWPAPVARRHARGGAMAPDPAEPDGFRETTRIVGADRDGSTLTLRVRPH